MRRVLPCRPPSAPAPRWRPLAANSALDDHARTAARATDRPAGRGRRLGVVVTLRAVLATTLAAALATGRAAGAQATDSTARTSLTGVTLSAPQQAALAALSGRTRGALQALYARAGARPGAPMPPGARGAVDSLIAAHDVALRALLTDDQRATFDDNVRAVADARRMARRARRRQGATMQAARGSAAGNAAVAPAPAPQTRRAGATP